MLLTSGGQVALEQEYSESASEQTTVIGKAILYIICHSESPRQSYYWTRGENTEHCMQDINLACLPCPAL